MSDAIRARLDDTATGAYDIWARLQEYDKALRAVLELLPKLRADDCACPERVRRTIADAIGVDL